MFCGCSAHLSARLVLVLCAFVRLVGVEIKREK